MKALKRFLGTSVVLLLSSTALAQSSLFTPAEVQTHRERIAQLSQVAGACLQATWDEHVAFFNKWGVSKFYGDRNPNLDERAERAQALREANAPAGLIDELKPISCIGLTVKCLAEGFRATGQDATWAKVYAQVKAADMDGTVLQKVLRQLGWLTLFWNPDPSKNAAWDQDDMQLNPLKPGKKWNPVWGGHAERYRQVMNKGVYYDVPVDDRATLVGFGTEVPEVFKKVPFFVGTAHTGYHVFPGLFGQVIEGHSARALTSIDNLQISDFNPLANGGGPRWTRTEKYRSGVIVIPPQVQGN